MLIFRRNDSTDTESSNSGDTPNPCAESFCTQALSLTTANSRLYLARKTTDNIVQYRTSDNGRAFDSWQNLTGQVSETPLALYSEPTGQEPRFDLFSVSKAQGTLVNRFLQSGVWSDWKVMSQDVLGSGVAGCVVRGNRTDVWYKQAGTGMDLVHKHSTDAGGTAFVSDSDLAAQKTATRPGVACRAVRDGVSHDVVVYKPADGSAIHRQFNGTSWDNKKAFNGSFIGEPYVVATSATRIDFLGIGNDKAMHHFSWGSSPGYSELESLGGAFASVPTAVVIGPDGARVDVLAVGTDGSLKHRVMTQGKWSDAWEDLGIAAQGAPSLVMFKDMVHLFAEAPGGELMHAFWDPANGALEWKSAIDLKALPP
jgi:hypothetical protein